MNVQPGILNAGETNRDIFGMTLEDEENRTGGSRNAPAEPDMLFRFRNLRVRKDSAINQVVGSKTDYSNLFVARTTNGCRTTYECAVPSCPYVRDFSRRADALKHVRTQHRPGKFRCVFIGCGHRCPRRDRMVAHCLRKHGDAGLYRHDEGDLICKQEACMLPVRGVFVPFGPQDMS